MKVTNSPSAILTTLDDLVEICNELAENGEGYGIKVEGSIVVYVDSENGGIVGGLRGILQDRVYAWVYDRNVGELTATFSVSVKDVVDK